MDYAKEIRPGVYDISAWPDCLIPGCPNKCSLRLNSPYCHPHTAEGLDESLAEIEVVTQKQDELAVAR